MSLDRSLRSASSLSRHRNVLKREERMARLQALGKWGADSKMLGMPKVANRKMAVAKSVKKKDDGAEAAASAKSAAPAKGAKK